MSTIYDALKKTEVKIKGTKEVINRPKRNNSKTLRFIILCILITIGLAAYFMGRKAPVSPSAPGTIKEKSLAGKKVAPLSVTGIFFSDGEYLALINEQVVKAGDFIEGCRVGKIDAKGVQIIFEDSSLRLNYP